LSIYLDKKNSCARNQYHLSGNEGNDSQGIFCSSDMWNLRFSSPSVPELVGENGFQIAKIGIRNL
jgi:hypothetical protein